MEAFHMLALTTQDGKCAQSANDAIQQERRRCWSRGGIVPGNGLKGSEEIFELVKNSRELRYSCNQTDHDCFGFCRLLESETSRKQLS